MNHFFNVDIAAKYGLPEAIILEHMYFWLEKNRANDRNFFEGRYWTYNSIKALSVIFPYLTPKKIRSALLKLEKEGLVLTGNFNNSAYDRTKWYSFTDLADSIFENRKIDFSNFEIPFSQKGKPIPDIYTDINTDNKRNNLSKDKLQRKEEKIPYGEMDNVLLTKEEYRKIVDLGGKEYIDKLSLYLGSTVKKYKSHYATIRQWMIKDKKAEEELTGIGTKYIDFNKSYENGEILDDDFVDMSGFSSIDITDD